MRNTKKNEREQHICAWRISGLSKTEYCRRNGLKRSSFYRWFREQDEPGQNSDGFIEIAVDRFQSRELVPSAEGEIGIVLPNGYRITIGKGFDPETFENVLTVLEVR